MTILVQLSQKDIYRYIKNFVDFSCIINFANNYEDIGHLNSIQKF